MRIMSSIIISVLVIMIFVIPGFAADEGLTTTPVSEVDEITGSSSESEGDLGFGEEKTPDETEPPEQEESELPEEMEVSRPEEAELPGLTETGPLVEAEVPEDGSSLGLIRETGEDVIQVEVPASGEVILNPYGLPVSVSGRETRAQIIHWPQELVNHSGFPVNVSVTVTGFLDGDARFAETPPNPFIETKELFLYVEFQGSPDDWIGDFVAGANQIRVTEYGETRERVITLEAMSNGYFRLFGEMSSAPLSVWGEENALVVIITYTFERRANIEL